MELNPRFKIGTLLKRVDDEAQIFVTDYFPMAEEYETRPGLFIRNEYNMYELFYLAGGKIIAQTALWLDEMVNEKKIEVASVPD